VLKSGVERHPHTLVSQYRARIKTQFSLFFPKHNHFRINACNPDSFRPSFQQIAQKYSHAKTSRAWTYAAKIAANAAFIVTSTKEQFKLIIEASCYIAVEICDWELTSADYSGKIILCQTSKHPFLRISQGSFSIFLPLDVALQQLFQCSLDHRMLW